MISPVCLLVPCLLAFIKINYVDDNNTDFQIDTEVDLSQENDFIYYV